MELKEKLIASYKELLKRDDISELKSEIEEVTSQFKTYVREDKAQRLAEFVSDGDKAEFFEMPLDEFDRAFEELNAKYNAILKEKKEAKKKEELKNLASKEEILKEFVHVIENEDVISEAFKRFNGLQEKWNSIGNVPSERFKDLQNEFRKKIEDFYYHINIYKELKINDLKKNLEQKEDLINRMSKLREHTEIKEIENLHKAYLMEWDQIGPTFKENWEEIKARFYDLSHQISDRIKDHYKGIRESQKENLEKKRALIEQILGYAETKFKNSSEWTEATDKIKKLQAEWKQIGFATKNQNQKIWEEFRGAANLFFENKSDFFKEIKGEQEKIKEVKKSIIEKAKKLVDIDLEDEKFDWKQRTQEVINLQKKWKSSGSAARHDEQKLWKKFRSFSDEFFKKKDEFFAGREDRQKENLANKNKIIADLKKWKSTKDKEKDLKALLDFTNRWNVIGYVPGKAKEVISKEFAVALDKAYSSLDVSAEERVQLAFQGKVNQLLGAKEPIKSLSEERRKLNERKQTIHIELLKLENNLQFFSSAKSDNPLLKEANSKIENTKSIISEIQLKIKLLNIEVNKLKKAAEAKLNEEASKTEE
ncbi:MAG: DUF349 domain-containing protein [Salibacteraceae bacterium]